MCIPKTANESRVMNK